MITEGKIIIDLSLCAQNEEGKVSIRSNRNPDIGRVFRGRSPREALSLLPMMFSVCGKAHVQAASCAFCSVNDEEEGLKSAGELVVLAENAREHLLRIILGWSRDNPEIIKQIPVQSVMSLVADMSAAVEGSPDEKSIMGVAQGLGDFLRSHLFSCSPEDWLQINGYDELMEWGQTTDSLASRYIGKICLNHWQAVGAAKTVFLPSLPAAELRKKMHAREANDFIAQPDWNGQTYETGPLSRTVGHPLVSSLLKKYGSGLLARNVARLVELAELPAKIAMWIEVHPRRETIVGMGEVETARGRLVHSVRMDKGVIADYRILAPTEWNFHSDGAVTKGLKTLNSNELEERQLQAHMFIEALDPCIDFEVKIS